MHNFVILSGCSGGGKSTLLAALSRRGFHAVEEPGRRIVEDEQRNGGTALPWISMADFARRAVALSLEDRRRMRRESGLVFFDRGLIDAVAGLCHATGDETLPDHALTCRYNKRVFMLPPWPEIYRHDDARRHGLQDAIEEYDRLLAFYPRLGYQLANVPKTDVESRADFILEQLGALGG